MMGLDISHALDPALLARDVGIICDPWQERLLREQPRRALLNCCRQAGKSTIVALLALWQAIYAAPSLILLLSPSQRQSAELFRVLMGFYSRLSGAPELKMESILRAEFSNGSRVLRLRGGAQRDD